VCKLGSSYDADLDCLRWWTKKADDKSKAAAGGVKWPKNVQLLFPTVQVATLTLMPGCMLKN